jgi:hypothetical protein
MESGTTIARSPMDGVLRLRYSLERRRPSKVMRAGELIHLTGSFLNTAAAINA